MDERLLRLQNWVVEQATDKGLALARETLAPVSGDASFRRYFRAGGVQCSWIAVDAPPEHENSHPFVEIATCWHSAGIRVPALVAVDLAQGFMLLEDFGDRLMLPELARDSVADLYGLAFSSLLRIQSISAEWLPPYNEAMLRREMGLFDEWFIQRMLGLALAPAEQVCIARVNDLLVVNAREQVQVCVHRDYHSRNLMLIDDGELGIIDFQDAVCGPLTYDLVSLLRDSYVRWPDDRVAVWVEGFRERLLDNGVEVPGPELFLKQFDLMGMQRQLKVLGIFSRLYLRDGKTGYLKDMPRTLGYLYRAAKRYPEMGELQQLIERRIVPAMTGHHLFDKDALVRELV